VEHMHYDQDGVARYYEVQAFPILDDAGDVAQIVEYNVDITERKRLEEELQNHQHSLEIMVQQLEQSNAELRQFTAVAAHDMRSPMAGVFEAAQILKEILKDKLDGDEQTILDILMRGVDNTTQIITSVYRCAQIDAGEISPRRVDLNRLVHELSTVQLHAEIERFHARIHVPDRLPAVLGDATLLLELMQNLVTNGLKYHRKGVAPEVIIRGRPAGENWVRIDVNDNGIGIRPDDLGLVFEMFQRLDDARDQDGFGMGLPWCKKIVERHGGRIGVDSTYGVGSTFWVELPRA